MSYKGRQLSSGNYLKLDDLQSFFNGTQKTFNLTSGGSAFYPGSAFSILVVLGGVIQEPESAYSIDQSQIIFAAAPGALDDFFCIALGVALGVGVPADGTVSGSKLSSPFNYNSGLLYLDSANNRIGVATATPQFTLDVNGDINLTGTFYQNSSPFVASRWTAGTGNDIYRLNGNVGIGTTNPTSKLTVQGDVRVSGVSTFVGTVELDAGLKDFYGNVGTAGSILVSTGAGVSWTTSGSSGSSTITNDTTTNATRFPLFSDVSSGSPTATYASSSKLNFNPSTGTLSATVFTSLSDRTQKTNITPITNALDLVLQMNGVKYNWIDGHNTGSIGVIAQEMEKVIPEVVTTNDRGLKTVSYGNLVGVLIEAIKEQQVRIEELEKKLNA